MINFTFKRLTKALGLAGLTLSGLFLNAQTANTWDWTLAGPVYNAGRIRNMIVDNSNPAKLYVGSTTSGIFLSIDNGANWRPVNDQDAVKNISYMAQANDGTIYAATGEGFLRAGQKAKAQIGTGLYKLSTNTIGGTLTPVASASDVGTIINRIACGPGGQIAVAGNMGILVSQNGGAFTQVTLPGAPTGTAVTGQDVKFDSNGILYCSIGTEAGVSSSVTASKIYKSSDATLSSFSAITPSSSVLANNFYGRIELAIAPSNNSVIYASCANKYVNGVSYSSTLNGLFVSYDGGNTWGLVLQGSAQLDPLSDGALTASGDYAHSLMVSANDPDILFFGGYSLYIYQRTGGSNSQPTGNWYQPSQQFLSTFQNYIHSNIHDIRFVSGNPNRFYFITDAGVYRSSDLAAVTQTLPPSFQPFYKNLVTGQYNSVSIERYPYSNYDELMTDTAENKGKKTEAYSGFIGGTGGNGVTYFSGRYSKVDTTVLVNQEVNYLAGDVYATEYSKLSYNSAIMSLGNGRLYRSTDMRKSAPTPVNINSYSGALSKIAPTAVTFENPAYNVTGTPFKFWENYGQAAIAPDSIFFYNDTIRALASFNTVADLTTTATFSFGTVRPNKYAMIDSIAIRTGTVLLPTAQPSLAFPFTTGQLITLKMNEGYVMSPSITVLTGTAITSSGPISTSVNPTVTLNSSILSDNISVTFNSPPFATKTQTSATINYAAYYKVIATIYYKYKAGDTLFVTDNNITAQTLTYPIVVPAGKKLNWNYGAWPGYTVTANTTPSLTAIANPSYAVSSSNGTAVTIYTTGPTLTVNPLSSPTTYTIDNLGTFTMSVKEVTYQIKGDPMTFTLTANTGTGTGNYTLQPGAITQTSNVFVVAPTGTATSDYTITAPGGSQTFSSVPGSSFVISPAVAITQTNNIFTVVANTLTTFTITQTNTLSSQDTYSTLSTDYVLNPGSLTQSSNVFTVNVTSYNSYTVQSIPSNTLAGTGSSSVYSPRTTKTITFGSVPFAKNNPRLKVPMKVSSRLAFFYRNTPMTGSGGPEAVMISKNPLSLNDPLAAIRLSQSGCLTDDANGNPSTNTISIPGRPVLLEWSKSGTELYYATSDNKVYRVSHIYDIQDYSSSTGSYAGKFATDVFVYGSNGVSAPAPSNVNYNSPFRTTLVGQFEKPVTSITVSNDNKKLLVTLNNPTATSTGTTGSVMYSNVADVRTTIDPVAGWSRKDNGLTGRVVNCSMAERSSGNVFLVGTDIGVFHTSDVSTGNWVNINTLVTNETSKLPRVEVFDIKQQTLLPNECYNSGQIYVATNGRGVWTNNAFANYTYVGLNEYASQGSKGNNLQLYPNPTNGNVNIAFNTGKDEEVSLQVMDISGRLIQTENIGKVQAGDVNYTFNTQSLNSGVYLVNINGTSGVRRVSKLIVTK